MNRKLVFAVLFVCSGCANFPRAVSQAVPSTGVYRGVYHVHTRFSHDSSVSLKQALKAGRKAGLDFVIITDHNNRNGEAAYLKMENKEGPLLIFGEEISTADGHLTALGTDKDAPSDMSGPEAIDWVHAQGGYALLAHPVGKRSSWRRMDVETFDGMEIYNFGHVLYAQNRLAVAARFGFLHTAAFLRAVHTRPEASLATWDEKLRKRPVAAVGAADAHVHFRVLGMPSESLLMMFLAVTTNVLTDSLDEKKIVEAIGKGRSFISFDSQGPARNFRFYAESGGKIYELGDRVPRGKKTFYISVPQAAEIRLLKDGQLYGGSTAPGIEVETAEAGVYRVEVMKDGDPWIFSNPIYAD